MTTRIPDRDCLECTLEEKALAERLGLEGRKRIVSRMLLGTPLLVSVMMEADYIADAWAHYDDKVQLHAIHLAFDVLRHWNKVRLVDPGQLSSEIRSLTPLRLGERPTKNPAWLSSGRGSVNMERVGRCCPAAV